MRNRVRRQEIEAPRGAYDGGGEQMQAKAQHRGTEIVAPRPRRAHLSGILIGKGYHPRADRKSAEDIENRRDRGLPLRKRVRNPMIMLGLQGCARKERTWAASLLSH